MNFSEENGMHTEKYPQSFVAPSVGAYLQMHACNRALAQMVSQLVIIISIIVIVPP